MSLTRDELEELANAMYAETGFFGPLKQADAHKRFFDSAWSALCHQTGRCGRFYQPDDDSPEARIYRLMSKAFKGSAQ